MIQDLPQGAPDHPGLWPTPADHLAYYANDVARAAGDGRMNAEFRAVAVACQEMFKVRLGVIPSGRS